MALPARQPADSAAARRGGGEGFVRRGPPPGRVVRPDPDFGADGTTLTVNWYDSTAGVVGTAIGVAYAAKQQTATVQQLQSQFGGSIPSTVDIHLASGLNPKSSINPFSDSVAKVGLFQVGTDASGNITLTQLYAGPLQWQSQFTVPNVAIDPNGGGLALFTGGIDDPVTFAVTQPGAAAPAPGTPGGAMATPAGGGNANAKLKNYVWALGGLLLIGTLLWAVMAAPPPRRSRIGPVRRRRSSAWPWGR
jgi:hypothetical protein